MLIWLAYFLLSNDAGGFVHGIPLGPVEAAALLALAWLAGAGVRMPGTPVVAILLAATYAAGAAIPGQGGFRARYFSNAAGDGVHERSTEYRSEAYTRIDRRLDFDPARAEAPLPFFNDNSRFNFYKAGEPQRRYLGFAVRWSGLWWVDRERPRVYLDAPAAAAAVFVDGREAIRLQPGDGSPAVAEIPVTPGWHRLDVTFSSPYGSPRVLSSGLLEDGRRLPFDESMVVTQQVRGWQMTSARLLRRARSAADVALLLCLVWLVGVSLARLVRAWRHADSSARLGHAMRLFWLAAAAEALVFALPWWRRNMVLNGGDDTMTYEGFARDILLNGILMNGGAPIGQGEPFYYQAFYPYFLAAAHALFGESMFGPVLLQRLLAAWAAWQLVAIAVAYAGTRAWMAALPLSAAFLAWKFWPIAAQPLNESLYLPLLIASAAALIQLCEAPRRRRAIKAGVLSGLATITRSTALLAWLLVWPACWMALKTRRERAAAVSLLAGSMLAVFSLITVRNWIVAGVFAPAPTELGITLRGGNEVPPGVTIDLAPRSSLYRGLGISEHTATVIEFALTAPGAFAQNLGRKALFALGFYEPYAPGWGYSPVYIAVWTSALAGIALALQTSRASVALLPALISLTQFVAVVLVYPKGERLILPIHALLLPYSAIAAWRLAQTAAARLRRSPASSPA